MRAEAAQPPPSARNPPAGTAGAVPLFPAPFKLGFGI